ncbi:hypothetical protein BDV06DRAFT_219212 [Aspergillus oleicola]
MTAVMPFQNVTDAGSTSEDTMPYEMMPAPEACTELVPHPYTVEGLVNMNAFMMNQEVAIRPEMPIATTYGAFDLNTALEASNTDFGFMPENSTFQPEFTAVSPLAEGEMRGEMPVYQPLSEYALAPSVVPNSTSAGSQVGSYAREIYSPPTIDQNISAVKTRATSASDEDADARIIRSQRTMIENLTAELEHMKSEIGNHEAFQESLEENLNLTNFKIQLRDEEFCKSAQRITNMKEKISGLEENLGHERTKRVVLAREIDLLKSQFRPQQLRLNNKIEGTAMAEVAALKRKLRRMQNSQSARKNEDLGRESKKAKLREAKASMQFRLERYEKEVRTLKNRASYYERRLSAATQNGLLS